MLKVTPQVTTDGPVAQHREGMAMSFNLAVILSETAKSSPDKPAAVFTGGRLTYRQLDQESDRLAPRWRRPESSRAIPSRCSCRTSRSS